MKAFVGIPERGNKGNLIVRTPSGKIGFPRWARGSYAL
jgi:hypothetical protein